MDLDKLEISKRLKAFLLDKFGTIVNAANVIGKSPDSLRTGPLSGNNLPSAEIIAFFVKFGGDIDWLFWGESGKNIVRESQNKYESEKIRREIESEKTKELIKGIKQWLDAYNKEMDKQK